MPIIFVRNDITKMNVDAVVNAANETLLGGGGVDGAIHRAAGPKLLEECRMLGGCGVGEAKITAGYDLPAKYIIHTVGPVWQGGCNGEEEILKSCYRNSLQIAESKRCTSIAFPLISSGIFGYPKPQALKVAVNAISEFLFESEEDIDVYITVFDRKSFQVGEKLASDIHEFIDDNYVDEKAIRRSSLNMSGAPLVGAAPIPEASIRYDEPDELKEMSMELDEALSHVDESFQQMLFRKIDEKGMKDSECYKKANIDRKLFSKIRKDVHYKPSKQTAIALSLALELSEDEIDEMLMKAGYALSNSSKFDIVIRYFIIHREYNIMEINSVLFDYDLPLLG